MGTKSVKTGEVFEAEIKPGEGRFALFYSAWCPFCTGFLSAYDAEAKGAAGAFLKICTDDLPELEDRFSIEVVPTVLYFKGGKLARRLDGALGRGLSSEGLRAFVAACAAPGKEK
jgi:thioredoxin 1